jgi:hypothetical protein
MTRRLKLLTVAALACAALLAALPSGASAARGLEVAVQDDSAFVQELGDIGDRTKALNLSEGLNATWIRANVDWNYVIHVGSQRRQSREPRNIVYNWTGYDALVNEAAARGIQVQLALTGPAPRWATGNRRAGGYKVKAAPYKRFVRAAAEHFDGRVKRYSIYNEPNHISWLSPVKRAPGIYRKLYIAGYSAIKSVDRNAKVLIGETSPYALGKNAMSPLKFLRGVVCANARYKRAKRCAGLKTDGYAHHPYDFRHKPTFRYPGKDNVTLATLGRLTSALSKLHRSKLLRTSRGGVPFVYLTEYGYMARGKYKVSESKRGKYLVAAFKKAQKNRRVKQMLQFVLLKPPSKYLFFATYVASAKGTPMGAYKKLRAWTSREARAGRIARPSGG